MPRGAGPRQLKQLRLKQAPKKAGADFMEVFHETTPPLNKTA